MEVVQMILKLRWFLSNVASFHFWTSDCCLVDSASILPKRTKTKTLEKQQIPVMQKDKGMTSCRTLVTLTHPKSQFSHQKTAFQGIGVSTSGRRSIVQAASLQRAAPGASGTWQVIFVGFWCERQLITCILLPVRIYSLYYCLISCNHDLDHWTIVRKLVAGPKQMHLHAMSAIHIVYMLLHMLGDNTTRRACKNTPVLPRITVNICTNDHKRTSIQGNGCTHVREVWTCEQHYQYMLIYYDIW